MQERTTPGGAPAPTRGTGCDGGQGTETWRIAGAAARRLGLDRLYPFDDFDDGPATADFQSTDYSELMASLAELARPHVAGIEAEVGEALGRGDLWPLWRRLNTAEQVAASEELESGLFLAAGTAPAREVLADWRTRNLLMAGRLRAVTRNCPGGRVLALVGQAHKGPMETALRTGQYDLDIADFAELDVVP